MNACTIVARNYLAHARVLAESFLDHHPDGTFTVLLLDGDHIGVWGEDRFELVSPYEIGIERAEFHRMAMIYDVMELATAVKPWLLRTLLDRRAGPVAYFDPDIRIFAPLHEVMALAEDHAIVLVPHVTKPMPRDGREPSETTILYSGVYNLGFIAVADGARSFLDWWSERLARECVLEPGDHRFVDQRWIDFVPGMFSHYILRDPGYDVAHWNLWGHHITTAGDSYQVDGLPLRFFHFSGFDPERPGLISKHQGTSPRVALHDHPTLTKLYTEYAQALLVRGYATVTRLPYGFGTLPGGVTLTRELRRGYRAALVTAEELGDPPPPEPFEPVAAPAFEEWLRRNGIRRAGRSRLPLALLRRFGVRGHGLANANNGTPRVGLNVAGYLRAELGIGEAARQVLNAVERSGVPYAALTYRARTNSRQDHPARLAESSEPIYDTNLICVNADGMSGFASTVGQGFFAGRYSIGLWWWEVSEFPPAMRAGLRYVDEVWVGSEHTRAAIAGQTAKPVNKLPMPVEFPPVETLTREQLGLPDGFVFLFTFDFFSVLERKNPLGLIDAFTRAFSPGEGPTLVLKSINGDRCHPDLARVRAAAGDRADVIVLDRYVSAREKNAMAASCDCYVSLHRSEGYGLTLAEAMAYGKPVIATAYSGNLEFMDDENSYLVPYRLGSVPSGCDPYPVGAEWAEPDLDVAAALMRRVYENRDEAEARGRRAREDILAKHGPERAAEFIRGRLQELREQRPSVLAGDFLFSAPPLAGRGSAVSRVADALRRNPNPLAAGAPLRVAAADVTMRVLLRALWPYIHEQRAAIEQLQEAQAKQAVRLERLAAELEERREDGGNPGAVVSRRE